MRRPFGTQHLPAKADIGMTKQLYPPGTNRERVAKHVVNLRPSQWFALRRLAFERGTSISTQVRRAVANYLHEEFRTK